MRVLIAVLLALAAAPVADAQETGTEYSGRTITAVRILVERQPADDPAAADLIETRQGQPLSMSAVRESITHLYSLGRFQDIQVEAIEVPGGVELRYNLVPLHAVQRVDFTGTLGLSERLLRRTMTERFGATPAVGRAVEVARVLEQLYADRGYFRASVTPASIELHDPDRTILSFQIDAGPQARVGKIDVTGDPRASRQELLNRLEVAPGRPYERVELQRDLANYVQRLKDRGFYRAASTHTSRLSADGRTADLTIDVQSGPAVRITYAGDPLPADRLKTLVPIEREGSADEDLLEDSAQRIRDYLHQEGYWRAEASFVQNETEGQLTIVFTIRKGLLFRVAPEGVEITGASAIPPQELRTMVALAAGAPYVSTLLDATEGAIRQAYRTRGFAWVELKSAINEGPSTRPGEGLVRPVIVITEGPRAVVGEVTIEGPKGIPEAELRAVLQSRPGSPYVSPIAAADREAITLEYLNRGYASAEVVLTPVVSTDRTTVDLLITIQEGPQTLVDHILIVGNRRTDEEVIRRELLVRTGQPLGLYDLMESRRRLSALGLFRRVNITQLEHGEAAGRDVLVTVDEADATTMSYGGGLEIARRLRSTTPDGDAEERIEFAPRGFFDIGRRNVGGRNRSVNLYTRLALRPENPTLENPEGSGFGFSEYRVVGTFREPRTLHLNADFTLTAAVEQGVRTSFNFARKGITAELVRRLTPTVRTSFRYTFGTTKTLDEQLSEDEQATIDRLFPQVRLSAFSAAVSRDTRDDVVEPTAGTFLSGEGSIAARALGGQVGFIKTYLQGYWFKRVPGVAGVVFATRASVGLADGFPREAQPTDADGNPLPGDPILIEDLPASERFFAGGDTTIRGFALDSVGAPNTITARGFPRGGNAALILNTELRLPVWRDVGAAVFVDGGNVFDRVTELDLGELRGAVGFGVRYRSPIGPIRLDLGFKMDRREFLGTREPLTVLHFSIGQAF